MTVLSGAFGVLDGLSTVRNVTISETLGLNKHVASNTQLGAARTKGIHSWSGSYSQYGSQPLRMPRDIFTFSSYVAPDNGVEGTAGLIVTGQAIVDQVVINFNFENGEPINIQTNFTGILALAKNAAQPAITDATAPALEEICAAKVQYAEADVTDVTSAVLTITAENKPYSNSSTIVSGNCYQNVVPGTIDWNLAVNRQSNTFLHDNGTVGRWDLYTNATEFWRLDWGMTREHSNFTVDNESGDIIAYTKNVEMHGHNGTSIGQIVLPDTTVWWPF